MRLRALETAVQVLSARLAHLDAGDVPFLAAIASSVQGRVFSAAELLAHAQVDDELRRVLAGRTAKEIGRRLRALADRDIGGFTLARVTRDASGIVWSVQPSCVAP